MFETAAFRQPEYLQVFDFVVVPDFALDFEEDEEDFDEDEEDVELLFLFDSRFS